ncbi:excinuclease ABC subunit UvrC [Amphiplicatus metriothermophilus]|uniref:UvrABC system protein C n=1 Tax=Amphiplicatus metriothermophilus TaxID=1519374 RepID=A0A239PQ57_9PROT|nr:excinuclease ABC subunit UvrC [Amphiplicatus metriothermophilus]MBB5518427.1 excinuclease ABC subunit C [Amphiplicatus metriothermophilus]SNT72411.1 Excinuclease ABC subunit C [Amphiplicatus metriothermophilus]
MTDSTSAASEAPALKGAALIADHVRRLPARPGVYRMIGAKGDVLYVGKARNLKARVSSYAKPGGHSNRIMRMIAETRAMEFVVTETETEALLLEANLIKQLKPRYNVILRDDKSFPYILITEDHAAPQILKHRGARKRKGSYYGPFASASAVNRTLNTLQKAFLLRSCSDSVYESRTRPCLLHQIKRCSAPCVGLISPEAYGALVADAKAFLSGRNAQIQRALSKEMEQAAAALDFERAASLRDRIRALTYVQGGQAINASSIGEADVFAVHGEGGQACVQVFFFRAGQNWGNHAYFPRHAPEEEPAAIIDAFIAQFYDGREPPALILVNTPPAQADLLAEALSLRAGRKVTIHAPQRGEKRDIVEAAALNAREALARRTAESASQMKNLERLAEVLGLPAPPRRIEVYDNSHIQGANAVGAMIVAGPEGFVKNQYRKFNIKTAALAPGDDYAMMREVLTRRLSRLQTQDAEAETPDLIVLDGGKGQLSAALEIARDLGIDPEADGPAVIAVAKGRVGDAQGRRRADRTAAATGEQIFMPGRAPFLLPPREPALFFLQRLRDEAHRFAIGAHRAKRMKALGANPLDDIPGVGAARKRALLHHFGSAKAVAAAKPEDLMAVEGVSEALAQRIYDFFHGG